MSMAEHQQQEDQGFEQGFASVMDPDFQPTAPAGNAAEAEEAGDQGGQGESAGKTDGLETAGEAGATEGVGKGDAQAGAAAEAGAKPDEGAQAESADGAPDPNNEVVLDGLTRGELRNLLARAAEVDGLKDGLRKAHGKIGEMNDRLRKAPAHHAPGNFGGIALAGLEGEAFDKAVSDVMAQAKIDATAFGDYSEEGLMRGIVTTMLRMQQLNQLPPTQQEQAQPGGQGAAWPVDTHAAATDAGYPAEQQQASAAAAAAEPQQNEPGSTQIQVEQLVLDRVRPGWRETVSGQDFNTWLGAQDQAFQQSYMQADTAEKFAGVLDKFGQWTAARDASIAAVNKSAKAQQRLEQTLTPTGNAPKPQAAMTEDEEFEAAFNAIAKQRL